MMLLTEKTINFLLGSTLRQSLLFSCFRVTPQYSLSRSYQISENLLVTKRLVLPLDICNAVCYVLYQSGITTARYLRSSLEPHRFQSLIEVFYMVSLHGSLRVGSVHNLLSKRRFSSSSFKHRSHSSVSSCTRRTRDASRLWLDKRMRQRYILPSSGTSLVRIEAYHCYHRLSLSPLWSMLYRRT